jgi:hypothetical protein
MHCEPAVKSRGAERHERRVHAIVRSRRLQIEQIGTGGAVRIRGDGVDVTVADLRHLDLQDLAPAHVLQDGDSE